MTHSRRCLVLVGFVSLHLAFDFALMPLGEYLGDERGRYVGPLLVGALFGQIGMLAAYWAWGSGHSLNRLVTYVVLATLMWWALAAGAATTGNSYATSSIETLLAICGALLILSVPLPFWVIRAMIQQRISVPVIAANPAQTSQFSIRHLLLWTAALAVLLAIATSSMGREVWEHWPMRTDDFLGILGGMLTFAMLGDLVAIPAALVALSSGCAIRPLVLVGACTLAMLTIEGATVNIVTGDNLWAIIAGINFGIWCQVTVSSLLLYSLGYRFASPHGKRTGTTN